MTERDDSDVMSVAASISKGLPVDWERIGEGPDDGGGVLRELRLIDRIATFHRDPDTGPASPDGDGPSDTTDETNLPAGDAGLPDEGPTHRWGDLEIVERIGQGAFGVVYRARDSKLQREVALKLLWPFVAKSGGASRALKEGRLLARLRHPNVATVYGTDEIDGRVGLCMEFVKGRTLAEILRTNGPFSPREAAVVGLDVCRALAAVHSAGLIHGDIKAHNVMREDGGRTVLMDFGTGKDLARDPASGSAADDFAGTPLYLAPEVFTGQRRTKATDVYSLGVLLFNLVTDSYPVEGRTRGDVERAHLLHERRHLRDVRPDLPAEFVFLIERALADSPAERYRTTGAFEAALARFLGAPVERMRRHWAEDWRSAAFGGVILALAAGASYWMLGNRGSRGSERRAVATAAVARQSAPATGGAASYTIDTALFREQPGRRERLRAGGRVAPGDELFVEVRSSVPTFVYIVNEDEHNESFLLYPLPGQNQNPLPAGEANRLPGKRNGRNVNWRVTDAGGREHFLIFASPQRLNVFEQMFASLPHPDTTHPIEAAPLSRTVLRSVGGLVDAPEAKPLISGPLTLQFPTPLGETEERAEGLWVRQLTLENPGTTK